MTILATAQPVQLPPLEDLVRLDGAPVFTDDSHGLQTTNLRTLWTSFIETSVEVPDGNIYDLGCGDGILFAHADRLVFPATGRRKIVAMDMDPEKVAKARAVAEYMIKNYSSKI